MFSRLLSQTTFCLYLNEQEMQCKGKYHFINEGAQKYRMKTTKCFAIAKCLRLSNRTAPSHCKLDIVLVIDGEYKTKSS